MKRPIIFAFLFLSAVALSWILSPSNQVSIGAPPASDVKSKGMEQHLSHGDPWIYIDDNEKPFRLKQLSQRFDSESIIEFLNFVVVQAAKEKGGQSPIIVVEDGTKRTVDGEEAFNKALRKLRDEYGVAVIRLPPPVGYSSALTKLRDTFDEFQRQKKTAADKPVEAK